MNVCFFIQYNNLLIRRQEVQNEILCKKKYIVYYIQQKAVLMYNNKNNFKCIFVRDSHVKYNKHVNVMNFEISYILLSLWAGLAICS